MKNNQKTSGVILSYCNILLGTVITILLVPFIIKTCSESEYAVYKIVSSFAAPLAMLNFGVGAYVSRGIAQCNQLGTASDKQRQNILGISLIISLVLWLIMLIFATIFYFFIDVIYKNTFTIAELLLGKKLYIIMALTLSINVFANGFQGCITGNEKFTFNYGSILIKTCLRGLLLFILLPLGMNTISIAICDLLLTILLTVSNIIYIKCGLKEKFKIYKIDKKELLIFFTFAASMFLQTLINNINGSLDNLILGAMISDKAIITMYSSSLTIFAAFSGLIYVVSGVFSPSIIKAITINESNENLLKLATKPCRIQAIISFAILVGFFLFGKNFIEIWIGTKYQSAYYICLILLTPLVFSSITGIYEAFLDAKLKRLVRTLILFGMALLNLIVSLILVNFIGYWGAAIGTALSLIIGNIIILNIYSSKVSGVNAWNLYKNALKGIWLSIICTILICLPFAICLPTTFLFFSLKIIIFLVVYCSMVYLIGLNKEEKTTIKKKFRIRKR